MCCAVGLTDEDALHYAVEKKVDYVVNAVDCLQFCVLPQGTRVGVGVHSPTYWWCMYRHWGLRTNLVVVYLYAFVIHCTHVQSRSQSSLESLMGSSMQPAGCLYNTAMGCTKG